MQSQSKGRNKLITRIWRFLTSWRKTKDIQGSQRPAALAISANARRRDYDLEIKDFPIRDRELATQLINLWNYGYAPRHALSYAARDVFSNTTGDDQGWRISKYLDEEKTIAVDGEIYDVLHAFETRKCGAAYVIGGNHLKRAVPEFLAYGNSFWELAIERETGTNLYGITRTMKLPSWEIFRCENDHGMLECFQQRRFVYDQNPYAVFAPPKIIHFRYEPKSLYGVSIFQQSIDPYTDRLEVRKDMGRAARAAGVVMKKHHFPEGWDLEQRAQYKADYQALLDEGAITDMFLHEGLNIDEVSDRNFDLRPLMDQDRYLKYEEIPPGFPVWLFPGLIEKGAREISGQPAEAYARMRNDWCAVLSDGIRWACDVELVLKLGMSRYTELRRKYGQLYRIEFPKWKVESSTKPPKVENTELDQFISDMKDYKKRLSPANRGEN